MQNQITLSFISTTPVLNKDLAKLATAEIKDLIVDGGLLESINSTLGQTIQANIILSGDKDSVLTFDVYPVPLLKTKIRR
jgi:hypothetical protein